MAPGPAWTVILFTLLPDTQPHHLQTTPISFFSRPFHGQTPTHPQNPSSNALSSKKPLLALDAKISLPVSALWVLVFPPAAREGLISTKSLPILSLGFSLWKRWKVMGVACWVLRGWRKTRHRHHGHYCYCVFIPSLLFTPESLRTEGTAGAAFTEHRGSAGAPGRRWGPASTHTHVPANSDPLTPCTRLLPSAAQLPTSRTTRRPTGPTTAATPRPRAGAMLGSGLRPPPWRGTAPRSLTERPRAERQTGQRLQRQRGRGGEGREQGGGNPGGLPGGGGGGAHRGVEGTPQEEAKRVTGRRQGRKQAPSQPP